MCKPCQSLDMQLTAATQKRSTTESQTWFASFITCGTREDGTFFPRLSHMPPDSRGRVQKKNLGCYYGRRSKGCSGGQCFGSSIHDLKSDLFCLSKLKYRDTKASQIKSHGTYLQHNHSNVFHCSIAAPRRRWLGRSPAPTHSRAGSKATSGQLQLCLAPSWKPPDPFWVPFPMQHHSPFSSGPALHDSDCGHCPLIHCQALLGGIWVLYLCSYFSSTWAPQPTIARLTAPSVRSTFTLNFF